jgi:UDP-4-amino-4,6-dideoxy-N-acetyl-beta-L-altrosamine N-acetyltransferase
MDDVNFLNIEKEDLEMIRLWRNSPDVSKYMYTNAEITPTQQEIWFNKIASEDNSKYWIIEFANKKIGLVYIVDIDNKNSKCYWGFYLGDSSVRGRGIGGKIEYNLLKYVFEELKLNKLCGEVFAFNKNVIKMHEKFGFKQEGYLKQHINKNGEFLDVVVIGLLKSEWDDLKQDLFRRVYCSS